MKKLDKITYDRRCFVKRFMQEGGLSYTQACHLYEIMCHLFEEAIITGNRITIGRVVAISPQWVPPRDIQMHFEKRGAKVQKGVHHTYFMDGHYIFKFKLYSQFKKNRQMKWMIDMPLDS